MNHLTIQLLCSWSYKFERPGQGAIGLNICLWILHPGLSCCTNLFQNDASASNWFTCILTSIEFYTLFKDSGIFKVNANCRGTITDYVDFLTMNAKTFLKKFLKM